MQTNIILVKFVRTTTIVLKPIMESKKLSTWQIKLSPNC